MSAGIDSEADLLQMLVHGDGVAIGQDKAGALALLGTDGPEDVGPHGALVARCRWLCAAASPTAGDLVLLPYAGLVGPPEFDLGAFGEFRLDGRQLGWEVFLKTSSSNSFWV